MTSAMSKADANSSDAEVTRLTRPTSNARWALIGSAVTSSSITSTSSGFGDAEGGVIGRNAKIATLREVEAARERGTVYCSDYRFREWWTAAQELVVFGRYDSLRFVTQFLEIRASTKDWPFARQDGTSQIRIALELIERTSQSASHLKIQGIALLRPLHSDYSDISSGLKSYMPGVEVLRNH